MFKIITCVILGMTTITFISCNNSTKSPLPIFGDKEAVQKEVDGELITDTIYHTIDDFSFIDQNNDVVNTNSVEDIIYIADFFFVSCPTICPKMHTQMLKVYEHIQDLDDVIIISHTMDPVRDSVSVLFDLASELGVNNSSKWHFVTGDKEEIFDIGNKSYMAALAEDPDAPGGNLHSGAFLLIDKQRRLRGFYDGTLSEAVDILIQDIDRLRTEE